jgi:transposase
MAKHTTICAGIDTGKRKLDVALDGSSEQLQVDNTAEGHKALLVWLRHHRVKRIGIEASGGYEQPVVAEMRRKGFVVVVFQPAQVRAFAKFHQQRAKNDKIDAALIATCTAAVKKIHAAPDPRLQPFAEHLTMIDQIGEDVARLKNRIESCRNARIKELWE